MRFEVQYGLDLRALAAIFGLRSPHRDKLGEEGHYDRLLQKYP